MTVMSKRVICLIDSLGAGGAQRQMVGLATFLKEKGYDVLVAIYHADKDELFYADNLLSAGVPYIFLKNAERNLTRPFYIARFISRYKPNVVISYLETPSICACIAKFFNRRHLLIVSERNTTQQTGLNEKIRFNLFRVADYVVPNAYAQEDYIKRTFSFLSNKLVTIPNFVDIERFYPNYHTRREIPEIAIVATIWASKNTLGFIDAVELLSKSNKPFHISWYGKDIANIDYYNACQQKIEEKRLSNYISLLEKTNKIADRYREADYFCLPSFYEGTPNVICEAMASGLPVACSDVCDNARYVAEGVNGFLFNPNNSESMAAAVEKMIGLSNDDYKAFSSKSRAIAEERLSKERFINDYIRIIE